MAVFSTGRRLSCPNKVPAYGELSAACVLQPGNFRDLRRGGKEERRSEQTLIDPAGLLNCVLQIREPIKHASAARPPISEPQGTAGLPAEMAVFRLAGCGSRIQMTAE